MDDRLMNLEKGIEMLSKKKENEIFKAFEEVKETINKTLLKDAKDEKAKLIIHN